MNHFTMINMASMIAFSVLVPVMAVDTCRSATSDEFNALPGVNKFFDFVKADFGGAASTGHAVNAGVDTPAENVVRGDSSTDRRGMLCMGGGPFEATPESPGDVTCSTQITDFGGQFDGGSGTITSQLQSGVSVAAQWSTTTSSSVGVGISTSVTANASIPLVADIGASISTTFTVTNEEAASTTSTTNQVQTFSATANVPEGSTCKMLINVTSCTINAKMQVPVTFSGFVNTHFDREVTYTGQPDTNKHFDWWISPSVYSMDQADLSSYMTVSGSLQSTSYGNAFITCTNSSGASNVPITPETANLTASVPV